MLVIEFARKYGFSGQDTSIAKKVYGNIDMTESDWSKKLSKEFTFNKTVAKPIEEKIETSIAEEKVEEVDNSDEVKEEKVERNTFSKKKKRKNK